MKIPFIIMVTLFFSAALFAQEEKSTSASGAPETKKGTVIFGSGKKRQETASTQSPEKESFSDLKQEARRYRQEGYEYQRIGNLDSAFTLYQKAIELDPGYAVPYNDLGIIYEARGEDAAAEQCYLQAVKIDPNFLSAYTNLALFYENKRYFDKASIYWKKRAELGSPGDPWTEKAKRRLDDIGTVSIKEPIGNAREQEVIGLLGEVEREKTALKKDDKSLAKDYFQRALAAEKKGDDLTALKIALDAGQLDPANTDITDFIDRIRTKLLSR